MSYKKNALSWVALAAALALVVAACAPAPTPAPTDTAVPPSPVPSETAPLPTETTAPAATAAIPNTGATAEATAMAGSTVMLSMNSSLGDILTDANGNALYAFLSDQPDVSNCTGTCATNWPPLTVPQGTTPTAGDGITVTLGTLNRADGSLQVTVNHMPVYTFASDANPGDTNGQGKANLWYVLDASGTLVKTMPATPAATATTYP